MTGSILATMVGTPRYAIYYAPAHRSVLGRFGAGLLGYDAFSGKELSFAGHIEQELPDWRTLSSDARKYGFHATLKAPLVLADGKSETELLTACESFAGEARAIPVIRPAVTAMGDFIAIAPAERPAELEQLAADCVRHFDDFRAQLTAEDRARRNPDGLTPRQRDHLDRWGYPYVMEEFRFHMTLTGRLPADRREPVLAILRQRFAALQIASLPVDRVAVFRQDNAAARFRVIGDWRLSPA